MGKHLTLAAVGLLALMTCEGAAQGVPLPWGQSPDMLAWEVYMQVTAPSGDPRSKNVEFETWASDQDIYKANPQWPTAGATKSFQISALQTARLHHPFQLAPMVIAPSQCVPPPAKGVAAGGFPPKGCIGEEVRRNWASFRYIVRNSLYTTQGLAQAYAKHLRVDLPSDSIELKGDWARVTDVMTWLHVDRQQVLQHYYVNTATDGKTTEEFALLAFHFSTKQIKDWVWSDFENSMNPGRCDDIGCHDSYGAVVADVAPRTPPNQQYGDCQKTPAVKAMMTNAGIDPVWANYCLKGTQIVFTNPTLLGNSVIERINAELPIDQSSCITCHAYASFNAQGQPNKAVLDKSPTGPFDPKDLGNYASADFIWGILFAPRK
jgi:hypothetical protein